MKKLLFAILFFNCLVSAYSLKDINFRRVFTACMLGASGQIVSKNGHKVVAATAVIINGTIYYMAPGFFEDSVLQSTVEFSVPAYLCGVAAQSLKDKLS